MRAAKAWGFAPGAWDSLPALDKARAMAYEEAERMMRLVDDLDAQDEAKR